MKKAFFVFAVVLLMGAMTTSGIILANNLKTEIVNDDPVKQEVSESATEETAAANNSESTEKKDAEAKSSCSHAEKKASCENKNKELTSKE